MNKLSIDNNGIDVQVAELAIINQKEQTVFGNANRDLILRTLGNIKIQVGSNFYDFDFKSDQSGNSVLSGVVILDTTEEMFNLTYPGDGTLLFTRDTATFYIAVDGLYIASNKVDPITNKIYLSYTNLQSLTGEEKQTVLFNTGYIIDSIDDVRSFSEGDIYPNQVVYSLRDGQHYKLTDIQSPYEISSWTPLYFTTKGGTVEGSIIINAITPVSVEIRGLYINDILPIDETEFNGLYLGDDYSKGLAFWWNNNGTFISSQSDVNGAINFLSGGRKMFTVDNGSVGIGGMNYNYQFYVDNNSYLSGKTHTGKGVGTRDFITGMEGVGFDIYKDSDGKWNLEIDKLFVRESSKVTDKEYETSPLNGAILLNNSIRIKSTKLMQTIPVYIRKETAGKYLANGSVLPLENKGRTVETLFLNSDQYGEDVELNYDLITLSYGIGDRYSNGDNVTYNTYNKDEDGNLFTAIGTHNYDATTKTFTPVENGSLVFMHNINVYSITSDVMNGIELGDLLYYKQWNADKTTLKVLYAEVVNIEDDFFDVYVFNSGTLTTEDALIKVGNINTEECLIQLNAFDKNNPIIEVLSNIDSFNDFVENIYYEGDVILEEPNYTTFKKEQIRVRTGWLTDIVNTDLGLDGTPRVGFYSDSVFIKGNIVGEKVIFGTQLNFENDILTIVDLETIKSRNITGTNGLTGGGNLFAGDINIQHGTSNWTNKTNLSGGTVISNLSVDGYGHLTNWTTRNLTTSDIPEGSNLYYTDARVQAFGDTRYALIGSGGGPVDAYTKVESDARFAPKVHTHVWEDITNRPTLLSQFSNDLGYVRGDGADWVGFVANNKDEPYLRHISTDSIIRLAMVNGINIDVAAYRAKLGLGNNAYESKTLLSEFTNDLGNYGNWITKAQGDTYYAAINHTHVWNDITNRPTLLSQFTNDLGNYGGFLLADGATYAGFAANNIGDPYMRHASSNAIVYLSRWDASNIDVNAYRAKLGLGSNAYESKTNLSQFINDLPSTATTWGSITGTLSSQTDLKFALDGKANLVGGNNFNGLQQTDTGFRTKLLSSTFAEINYYNSSGKSYGKIELNKANTNGSGTDFVNSIQIPTSISGNRVWTLPDKTGTFAMLDDIGAGSSNWTRTSGGLLSPLISQDALSYVTNKTNGFDITHSGSGAALNVYSTGFSGLRIEGTAGFPILVKDNSAQTLFSVTNIGIASFKSEVSMAGIILSHKVVSANYSVASQFDTLIECTAGVTVTLNFASVSKGRLYIVKNNSGGSVTVNTADSNIDGATSKTINPGAAMQFMGTGSGYLIVGQYVAASWP